MPGILLTLPHCTVEHCGDYIRTNLDVGGSSSNWPHPDDPSYVDVARQCGFADLMQYTAEHEVLHSLLPWRFFDRPGYVIRMAAQGRRADLAAAKAEERLIYYLQRYIRQPLCCPDPQWVRLRAEMLRLREQWVEQEVFTAE